MIICLLNYKEPDGETNFYIQKTLKRIESQSFLQRMVIALTLVQIPILLFTICKILIYPWILLIYNMEIILISCGYCEVEMILNGIIYI